MEIRMTRWSSSFVQGKDDKWMQFIAIMGGEIEYDGHLINVKTHRGSTVTKQLLETKNVTDVSVTYEGRASSAS